MVPMARKHGLAGTYTNGKCRCDLCKEAHRLAASRDRDENLERINAARRRRWHEGTVAKETQRRWAAENPDRIKDYKKREYWKNRERDLESSKVRYQLNKKAYYDRVVRYRQTPRGKAVERASKEKRRRVPYTPEAVEWMASLVDPLCTYCGKPADTIDHIVPIAKGGTGDIDNLTPACRSCNSKKHTTSLAAFAKRMGLTGEAPAEGG